MSLAVSNIIVISLLDRVIRREDSASARVDETVTTTGYLSTLTKRIAAAVRQSSFSKLRVASSGLIGCTIGKTGAFSLMDELLTLVYVATPYWGSYLV